jgi:hypothetical protein
MDPDKVDSGLAWKVPTNRELLRGFLGSVGYLTDDLESVRVPMGILHGLTSDSVPFRWTFTHQRAFEDIKATVSQGRDHHRRALNYSPGADPIWLVSDGCSSGIAAVVCQGPDWKNAKVPAFFSAKLNSAQQNYPVHEIEMLAGIEAMLRHRDILQGCDSRRNPCLKSCSMWKPRCQGFLLAAEIPEWKCVSPAPAVIVPYGFRSHTVCVDNAKSLFR